MQTPVKVFIAEDEMIIAANISLQLTQLGYEVTGIVSRGEEVLPHLRQNNPDVVILDIQLKGKMNGIDTARQIRDEKPTPVIFLTANSDDANFNRAKETKPYAFISKPFKKLDLQRAIELTINRVQAQNQFPVVPPPPSEVAPYIIGDCVYVRHKDNMIKVMLKDIYYIEAQRNYCRIYTRDKEYLLVLTLKDAMEKLPNSSFLRIHRSYLVNLARIDKLANSHVVIAGKAIPVSKSSKGSLLKRLQML